MKDVEISIIIPCHNVEEYLGRCMQSILAQTIGIDKLEIILVNDASTDKTWDIIMQYEAEYPQNIIAINLIENVRQGGARNQGLGVASGRYITFVDSDDWIEPDMYEKMYGKMQEYDCDIVFCRNFRDDGTQKGFQKRTGKEDRFLVIDSEEKRSEFIASNLIGVGVWDKLYRRELILEHDIWFLEKMAYEDIHWGAILYLYAERVYMLEERLYHYFVNTDSTILKKNMMYHLDILQVNLLKWEEYIKRGALQRFPEAVEYDFLLTYYIAGIKMLAQRFDVVPYEVFYEMQKTVKLLVPDYKKNKYLNRDAKEVYKLLLGLVETSLSEQEIDMLLADVRKIKL